jgi:hypothetical protein
MLGTSGLESQWRPGAFLGVLGITTLLVTALPLLSPWGTFPHGTFRGGTYAMAVAAVALAIVFVASPPLNLRRRSDLLVPIAGIMVGLHFIGLWRAVDTLSFLLVAIAICLISALAFFVPDSRSSMSPRRMLVGFGCAMVLWMAGGAALI